MYIFPHEDSNNETGRHERQRMYEISYDTHELEVLTRQWNLSMCVFFINVQYFNV